MIENLLKIIYNVFTKNKEVNTLQLKPFSSQISIFLSDGIMNPSRLLENIAKDFDNLFTNQEYLLSIEDAPADMPLIRYSSSDKKFVYDFAKKRINFYLNFSENDNLQIFEDYKQKIKNFLNNSLLKYSSIARIGIAINYYINQKDDQYSYWVNKYHLPLYKESETSEVSYRINNNFINHGLKYNKIFILTNGKISNTKIVPVISIDINNLPTAKMNTESINFMFDEIDYYKPTKIQTFLGIKENQ